MSMVQDQLVGRPRKGARLTKSTEPRTIGVRASAKWADWLEKMAKKYRTTSAGLIDRALAEWAVSKGDDPPPERVP